MTDDSTEGLVKLQKGFALADATMPNESGAPQRIEGQPLPHVLDWGENYDIVDKKCTFETKAFGSGIELTDGTWKVIRTSVGFNADGDITGNDGVLDCSLDTLLGQVAAKSTSNSLYVSSGDILANYNWFKLCGVKLSLINWLVIVERDSSGGIQCMDEPVFQIRRVYTTAASQAVTDNNTVPLPLTVTTSDLQKGLHLHVPTHTDGWIHGKEFQRTTGDYYELRTFCQTTANNGANATSMGRIWCEVPNYMIQIRLCNIPVLTNIRFVVNYRIRMEAHWKCMVTNQGLYRVLGYPGPPPALRELKRLAGIEDDEPQENKIVKIN